jgi:glycosyltransferase involved in cell wall biosynthesis
MSLTPLPTSGLRIGIDARPLATPLTGIGTCVREILREFALLAPENQVFCYTMRDADVVARHLPAGGRFIVREGRGLAAAWGTPWLFWGAGGQIAADELDVFWGTNLVLPVGLRGRVPLAVTCHDLVFRLYPETLSFRNRLLLAPVARRSFRAADAILADSEATATDLTRLYGVDPATLRVVLLAAGERFHSRDPAVVRQELRSKLGLEGDYVLFVGTLEPRKNLRGFLAAMAAVAQSGAFDGQAVVVGGKGWKERGPAALGRDHPLGDRLRFLGYVGEGELPLLYAGARLFVMPSLYEGFGLPVLEAMQSGVPVITTTSGSLAEVAGGAAVLVPPADDPALARAIGELWNDPVARADLAARGRERARAFSWRRTATELLDVLTAIARRGDQRPR